MKVLHVIASMDPKTGGVCQAVKTIANSLSKLKVENEIVSLDAAENSFNTGDLFTWKALGPAKGPWVYGNKVKPWLIENIARFNVVIIHGLWLYPSYITTYCFNKLKSTNKDFKAKLFVMPHGMLDPYFQKASGRKLKALRNKIYWQLIEANVVNKADGLLFTCEEEKILARRPFKPYHPKSEVVVGLGVEKPPPFTHKMQEAFAQKCPEIDDAKYILFLGRIHEKKGTDLLINSYIKKLDDWKKTNQVIPKLVIAGPGLESAFGQKLIKLIEGREENNNYILFPGMLEGDAKWGAFYNCSAFVLPSHQENFGIAVVEALACGKPVLISNQVNIWREINESKAGIIADDTENGVKELLDEFKKMWDMGEIELMGQHAQHCYEKKFAVNRLADRLFIKLTQTDLN